MKTRSLKSLLNETKKFIQEIGIAGLISLLVVGVFFGLGLREVFTWFYWHFSLWNLPKFNFRELLTWHYFWASILGGYFAYIDITYNKKEFWIILLLIQFLLMTR